MADTSLTCSETLSLVSYVPSVSAAVVGELLLGPRLHLLQTFGPFLPLAFLPSRLGKDELQNGFLHSSHMQTLQPVVIPSLLLHMSQGMPMPEVLGV